MKRWKGLLALLVALAAVCALSFIAPADFGDFAGDTDFGGGDSGWSGGDWDSDWDSSWDSDWDVGFGLPFSLPLPVIIAVIVAVAVIMSRSGKSGGRAPGGGRPQGAAPTAQERLRPMAELQGMDPAFSASAMTEKISNLYIQFQNSWQAKDLTPVRPYLTDALYAQMDRQLQTAYVQRGLTNRIERIAVLGVELRGFYQDETNDALVAEVRARIVDYVTNDATGQVVRGNPNQELFMTYEWTLVRSKGMKTVQGDGVTTVHCPNCGAVVDLNQSAQCRFCGGVLQISEYDWAVSQIKGISQSGRQ